jgi:hypothetical protein
MKSMTMKLAYLSILGCAAVLLGSSNVLHGDEPIPRDQFGKLHALIKPKASEESWTKIPWLTSLWEARLRAAADGKPILLWEMDGHPLGCT